MQELRTDRRPPGDSTLVMDPPQASSRRCGARRVRPARSSVLALHPSCHNNRDHLKVPVVIVLRPKWLGADFLFLRSAV